MKFIPYLNFNGNCEEAFRFYEKCLGGKIAFLMTWEDSPMAGQAPPGWGKKVCHATLDLGDQLLQGADPPPEQYRKPQGITLSLNFADALETDRVFGELAKSADVQMPLQETFWAERFGALTDRFGTPWQIQCERPPA